MPLNLEGQSLLFLKGKNPTRSTQQRMLIWELGKGVVALARDWQGKPEQAAGRSAGMPNYPLLGWNKSGLMTNISSRTAQCCNRGGYSSSSARVTVASNCSSFSYPCMLLMLLLLGTEQEQGEQLAVGAGAGAARCQSIADNRSLFLRSCGSQTL